MKKTLFIALSLGAMLSFSSCQSDQFDNQPVAETKTQIVTFNVSPEFSEEIGNMRVKDASNPAIQKLFYAICKNDEYVSIVKKRIFSKEDLDAQMNQNGALSIKDTLPTGDYKVIMLAFEDEEDCGYLSGSEPGNILYSASIVIKSPSSEIYHVAQPLHIGNQPVNEQIVLSRTLGRIDIVISDADKVGADVTKIEVELDAAPISISVCEGSGALYHGINGYENYRPLTPVVVESRENILKLGKENPMSFKILASPVRSIPLEIAIYKKDGTIVRRNIKRELIVHRGKIVELTGSLFDAKGTSTDWGVNVDLNWSESATESFDY